MTPLIFAGPPLIWASGDVGVLGDDLEVTGDRGDSFVTIGFVGGGLTGCAVFVVWCCVVGGGPAFWPLVACVFSVLSEALVSLLASGSGSAAFGVTSSDAGARPVSVAF